MDKEIWKDIIGYEGLYQISTLGRVKSLSRIVIDSLGRKIFYKERIMRVKVSKSTGYPYIGLSKDGIQEKYNIHTLIAKAFIPNPNNLPCVNHIDQDRGNSVLNNLEWCTYSYNNSYGDAATKRKASLRKTLTGKHKIIYQYTTKGDLIRVFVHGISQFEEILGYEIQDCLTGKSKTSHGFVFSYNNTFSYIENKIPSHQKYVYLVDEQSHVLEKYKSVSEAGRKNGFDRHFFSRSCEVDGIITIKGLKFIVEQKENEYIPKGHKGSRPDLKGLGAKPVCQYDKEGNFIREFNSTIEAAEFMGNKTYSPEITNCCKGRLKTARGFLWTYKGAKKPKPFKSDTLRKIEQYSIDGEYINTYNSIKEAATIVGNGKPGSIGNNLKGISHSAFGYIWKYAKEE